MLEEGQPLHAPFKTTLTIPSENESNSIAPPSPSTAGLMYSSKIWIISFSSSLLLLLACLFLGDNFTSSFSFTMMSSV